MHMHEYAKALQAIAMSGRAAQILRQARPQPGKAKIGSLLLRTGSQAMPMHAADSKRPRAVNRGPLCCYAGAWLLALGAVYMSSSMMAGLMR